MRRLAACFVFVPGQVNCRSQPAGDSGVSVADIWRLYRPHREQARSHRGSRARLHFVPGRGQLWERGLPAKAVYRSQISGVCTGLIASRLAPTGDRGRGYISCLAGVNCGSVACPRRRCVSRRIFGGCTSPIASRLTPTGTALHTVFAAVFKSLWEPACWRKRCVSRQIFFGCTGAFARKLCSHRGRRCACLLRSAEVSSTGIRR